MKLKEISNFSQRNIEVPNKCSLSYTLKKHLTTNFFSTNVFQLLRSFARYISMLLSETNLVNMKQISENHETSQ